MRSERPQVITLMSASVDGRTALGPGRSQWEELDDPRSRVSEGTSEIWDHVEAVLDTLHTPQVKMLGSESIVKASEPLEPLAPIEGDTEWLYEDYLPEEVIRDAEISVWLVSPDSRGRLRSGYKGTETPGHHSLHLVSRKTPAAYLNLLREQCIPYLMAGLDRVDLPQAVASLGAVLGVRTILSIGGGRLNGALLRAGLIDEINVIVRPELIGGISTPTLFDCADLEAEQWPVRLELIHARQEMERFLWLRYRVVS